jgi:hypothetical protein
MVMLRRSAPLRHCGAVGRHNMHGGPTLILLGKIKIENEQVSDENLKSRA